MKCLWLEDYKFPKVCFEVKKPEGTAAEIIDITMPGSDENIELGHPVPVVELDQINSVGRWKDIPPSDTPGLIFPAYAPDDETEPLPRFSKSSRNNNQQVATIKAQICQHPLVKQSILKVGD